MLFLLSTAASLFLLEEVSLGAEPRIFKSTTDTSKYWGKGGKTKDPKPIFMTDYGKKTSKNDRFINIGMSSFYFNISLLQ